MQPFMLFLSCASLIICALVSGVFLTFSDFVMRSLHKADRAGAIEVMQIINREVFRTLFMVLLMGMAALSFVMIWLAWANPLPTASNMIIAGGVTYIALVFGITIIGNVPLNEQLDRLDHSSVEAAEYWAGTFYPRWTFFNQVRTAGSTLASLFFLLAII